MSLFEAGMIVCFGISWPVAIMKTLKTRSVHGKSRMFLFLVLGGYGLGILHKALYSFDLVVLLYVFNFSMVFIELCLWFRYHDRPISPAAPALDEEDSAADTLLADPALVHPSLHGAGVDPLKPCRS
jgi:hypothetical protein